VLNEVSPWQLVLSSDVVLCVLCTCHAWLLVCCRWVRCVAFDPSNEWFCTGSSDRTIKLWETGTGQLKLTLTGHIEQVTGLAVSPRHPYMFSCSLDKEVKCWDLEHNKVSEGGVGGEGVFGGWLGVSGSSLW